MNYISASQLNTYCDCSLKYKFQYIDKIEKPKESIHLHYGSAIHKAIEELNKSLIESKIDIEDFLQVFHNEFSPHCNGFFDEKLYNIGIDALIKYYRGYIDYEVLMTEQEFSVDYKGETIVGVIDAVIKQKNKILVVDYKTSKEPYDSFKIKTSIQLSLYSYAFRELLKQGILGKKRKEDGIAYWVLLKDYKNLIGDVKIHKTTIKNYNRLFYILDEFIGNKQYLPNYQSISCKWCDYKKECLSFKS